METFLQFLEQHNEKTLYIMRGVSGSGKSTLANSLAEPSNIFSTDDFFVHEDDYIFDPSKLGEAHKWNQDRANEAMSKGITPIVIDNTNTQAWEAKAYVESADKHDYKLIIIKEPDSPIWKEILNIIKNGGDFEEVANELSRINKHDVPKEVILGMLQRYEPDITVDKIRDSKSPFDDKV